MRRARADEHDSGNGFAAVENGRQKLVWSGAQPSTVFRRAAGEVLAMPLTVPAAILPSPAPRTSLIPRLSHPLVPSGPAPLSTGGGGASPAWKFCRIYPDLNRDY